MKALEIVWDKEKSSSCSFWKYARRDSLLSFIDDERKWSSELKFMFDKVVRIDLTVLFSFWWWVNVAVEVLNVKSSNIFFLLLF